MIAKVYLWDNNTVMVFDEHGEQIMPYQGKFEEVSERILRDCVVQTKFFLSEWSSKPIEITREQFKNGGLT